MYLAITVNMKEYGDEDLFYAYAERVTEQDNIAWKINSIKNLVHANIFATKKKATEVVKLWNDSYEANGTYAFSLPF